MTFVGKHPLLVYYCIGGFQYEMIFKHNRTNGIDITIDNKETTIVVTGPNKFNYSRTISGGGDAMNKAVKHHVETQYNLRIGDSTAEEIVRELGSAIPFETRRTIKLRARRLPSDEPEFDLVSDDGVNDSLKKVVTEITEAVKTAVSTIPSEIFETVKRRGIVLGGSRGWLRNLGEHLEIATGIQLSSPPLRIKKGRD